MKAKAEHLIAKALDILHKLSEDCATEPNQWLTINNAEIAIHEVRKAFEQELDNGD